MEANNKRTKGTKQNDGNLSKLFRRVITYKKRRVMNHDFVKNFLTLFFVLYLNKLYKRFQSQINQRAIAYEQMNLQGKQQQHDSDFQSCDSQQSVDIDELVENAIKQLPSLQLKVQAIAINNYILQKRELDAKKQTDIARLQYKTRLSCNSQIQQMYAIIQNFTHLSKEDYQFVASNKQMFKEGEFEQISGFMNENSKLNEQNAGFDQFWLKCFQNSDIISEQIHQNDKQVLKHLYRVQASKNQDNSKLKICFFFKPNKWFSNQKLQKEFRMDKQGEPEKSIGNEIEWKQNMNYTVKKVKKKGKKGRNQKQQIIRQPSFFHYFTSISSKQQQNNHNLDQDQWDDLMEDLEVQFELSNHIYQDIIPKCLQYYLGVGREKHQNQAHSLKTPVPIDQQQQNEVEDP